MARRAGLRLFVRAGLVWGTALLGLASCSSSSIGGTAGGNCEPGQKICAGSDFQTCGDDGNYQVAASCGGTTQCDNDLGCVACAPNTTVCANNGTEVHSCGADGTVGALTQSCSFGQTCSAGECVDSCEVAASDFVYLVDDANHFLSFEPRNDTAADSVKLIGTINCPAMNGSTPNSMGVDRHARAWVGYQNGEVFWVNPQDASCQPSGYTPSQLGFVRFGMGFVSDSAGSRNESLYVGAGPGFDDKGLGRIDPMTLMLSAVAQFPSNIDTSPELTGTGAGELYGYFPSATAGNHLIARINKASAQFDTMWSLDPLPGGPAAWAFAHWGGRYYQFVTSNNKNQIRRYDPTTQQNVLVQDSIPYKVVGAGVSTCAPYTVG